MTYAAWEEVPGPFDGAILALATDARGAVFASASSGLYVSRDDGRTWRKTLDPIQAVATGPAGEIWAAGDGLQRSSDGGTTWDRAALAPPEVSPPAFQEQSETTAFAVSPVGQAWMGIRTTELTSYPENPDDPMPIYHWAPLCRDYLYRSIDRGATWQLVKEGIWAKAFAFDSRGRMWMASTTGLHLHESDEVWTCVFERSVECVAIDARDRIVLGTSMPAFVSTDGGKRFQPIAPTYREKGPWGSMEGDALDFRVLIRGSDGAVWAGTAGIGGGVFRLADSGTKWLSVNVGLTLIPRVGQRPGLVRVSSLAFTPTGIAFAGTEDHGLFRRPTSDVPG